MLSEKHLYSNNESLWMFTGTVLVMKKSTRIEVQVQEVLPYNPYKKR